MNPDGTEVDFRNLENSFTLEVNERIFINDETLIRSKSDDLSEDLMEQEIEDIPEEDEKE